MHRIDVIVAVRNEEACIPEFLEQVRSLRLPEGVALRLIFVEDSSTDGTRALLRRLACEFPFVNYYSVEPGFGQAPALVFGLSRSDGDAMIVMDVDGSHPVDVIPQMIRGFMSGAKVMQCVRRTLANRKTHRRLGAAVFFVLARALTGFDVDEQKIYFRLMSADVARWLLSRPRYWWWLRFPLPSDQHGAVGRICVDALERTAGESKYGLFRLIGLGVNGMLSLMPWTRFAALVVVLGCLVSLLLWLGIWWVSVPLLLGVVWLVLRYWSLEQHDLLSRMRIVEAKEGATAGEARASFELSDSRALST
jgi:glycosyltransferase involved in cell wall biosynthesis